MKRNLSRLFKNALALSFCSGLLFSCNSSKYVANSYYYGKTLKTTSTLYTDPDTLYDAYNFVSAYDSSVTENTMMSFDDLITKYYEYVDLKQFVANYSLSSLTDVDTAEKLLTQYYRIANQLASNVSNYTFAFGSENELTLKITSPKGEVIYDGKIIDGTDNAKGKSCSIEYTYPSLTGTTSYISYSEVKDGSSNFYTLMFSSIIYNYNEETGNADYLDYISPMISFNTLDDGSSSSISNTSSIVAQKI